MAPGSLQYRNRRMRKRQSSDHKSLHTGVDQLSQVIHFSKLHLRLTAPLQLIFISNKLQSNGTWYYSGTKKLLFLNAFEPATSRTARTPFAPNYSATVMSLILIFFFLHYYTLVTKSARKDVLRFVYTLFCKNLTAFGVRNVLRSVESSSNFRDFFTCRPAKYTFLALYLVQG